MKLYTVAVPITGLIYIDVKAESEEAAIDAALASDDLTLDKAEEWYAHRHIVQGNVFYGTQNVIKIVGEEEAEDEDA